WVLNYAVDQTGLSASELKVLLKNTAGTERPEVRYVDTVSTILLVNELRALIFFPRVSAHEGYDPDLSCGFLVPATDLTYRLLVELFDFLWSHKSTRGQLS
ncbi:MAG: hypothetical protein ACXV2F_06800, partial [Halobacteriota archaeon]